MRNTAVAEATPTERESLTTRVLDYWFGGFNDETPISMSSDQCRLWHAKNPQTDADIRDRFLQDYRNHKSIQPTADNGTARDRLALIILFDQFTRNMFRDTAEMYDTDPLALAICLDSLDRSLDQQLTLIERMFLYMPLMHAENMEHQNRMLDLFNGLAELARTRSPVNVSFFEMAQGYARHHRHIVETFGRFPHRNASLGRASTPQEVEFLNQPNSAF
jgi:uncharacterized protein (DUF924 family)